MLPFHTFTLPNGLIVEFYDLSNRYFGDYWRVSIEARCRIPLDTAFAQTDPELPRARTILGEEILYRRTLERMGVPGEEVSGVCRALADSFIESATPYLSDPSFVGRFVRSQLADRKGRTRPYLLPK
jgi:hypothetical protein